MLDDKIYGGTIEPMQPVGGILVMSDNKRRNLLNIQDLKQLE